METRQKTEYKIYYISLADVRGGVDKAIPVAVFDDIEKLRTWYENQRGDWTDEPSPDAFGQIHAYQKAFKKGSPLEWYNPAINLEPENHPDNFGGVGYAWVETLQFNVPFNPS